MSKKLSELDVDHEYAPGEEPTFRDMFLEWWASVELTDQVNSVFVMLFMLGVYFWFRFVRSIFRVAAFREEMERLKAKQEAERARRESIASMRSRLSG